MGEGFITSKCTQTSWFCLFMSLAYLCLWMHGHPGLLPVTYNTVRLHGDTLVHLVTLPWACSDILYLLSMSSRDDRNRVWVLIPAMAGSWGGERDGQSDWWVAKEEEREDGSDDNVMDELQQNGKRRHHSSFPREQTSALEISSTTPFIHLGQTVINGHVMLAQICSVSSLLPKWKPGMSDVHSSHRGFEELESWQLKW